MVGNLGVHTEQEQEGLCTFFDETHTRDAFRRGPSLKEYLERIQHTDPARAVTEILPFHPEDLAGRDEAA